MAHGQQHASQRFGLINGTAFAVIGSSTLTDVHQLLKIANKLQNVLPERLFNPTVCVVDAIRHGKEVRRNNQFVVVTNAFQNFCHAVGMGQSGFPGIKLLIQVKRFDQAAGQLPVHRSRYPVCRGGLDLDVFFVLHISLFFFVLHAHGLRWHATVFPNYVRTKKWCPLRRYILTLE